MEHEDETDILESTAGKYFNIDYLFPYQRLVITNILEASGTEGFAPEPVKNGINGEWEIYDARPHQIVILPTGAGKSLCYMLPAVFLKGPTLVVFPLLSLIADQERRLSEAGLAHAVLRGGQSAEERTRIWNQLENRELAIILTNPETVLNRKILNRLGSAGISHLVIDEMHVVSEWGDTFRPVYRDIGRIHGEAGIKTVTAFTATASPLILNRVKELLFPKSSPAVISASPDRPNIRYRVIRSISKKHDLSSIIEKNLWGIKRPVIVFNRSRTGAELTAAYLRRKMGVDDIFFYHAGLDSDEKKRVENWFFYSKTGILSSTCAYGLGVDKKNVRTVIHMDPSPSVEAYIQESGRAGRDGEIADAVLLVSGNDFCFGYGMKNMNLKKRYLSFLKAVTDNKNCRRNSLLKLLGAAETACSGCDVCMDNTMETAAGYRIISSYLKHRRKDKGTRSDVITLSGRTCPDAYRDGSVLSPYFGLLEDWKEEEITEALNSLRRKSRKSDKQIR